MIGSSESKMFMDGSKKTRTQFMLNSVRDCFLGTNVAKELAHIACTHRQALSCVTCASKDKHLFSLFGKYFDIYTLC
jgi:hypothetical protein